MRVLKSKKGYSLKSRAQSAHKKWRHAKQMTNNSPIHRLTNNGRPVGHHFYRDHKKLWHWLTLPCDKYYLQFFKNIIFKNIQNVKLFVDGDMMENDLHSSQYKLTLPPAARDLRDYLWPARNPYPFLWQDRPIPPFPPNPCFSGRLIFW